jgi:hypothetical protein
MALLDQLKGLFKDKTTGDYDISKILAGGTAGLTLLAALDKDSGLGKFFGFSGDQQPVGYQGKIPELTGIRAAVPQTYDPNRRPGSGGQRYFSDMTYGAPDTSAARQEAAIAQAATLRGETPDWQKRPQLQHDPKKIEGAYNYIMNDPSRAKWTNAQKMSQVQGVMDKEGVSPTMLSQAIGVPAGDLQQQFRAARGLTAPAPSTPTAGAGISKTLEDLLAAANKPKAYGIGPPPVKEMATGGLTSLRRTSGRRAQSPVSFRAANSSQRPPQQRPQQWDPGNGAAGRLPSADGFSGPMVSPMQPGMSPAGGKQLDPSVMPWLSGMSGKSPTGGMAQANSDTYDVFAPPASHAPMGGRQQTGLPDSIWNPSGNLEMARRALGDFFPPPGAGPAGGMSPAGGMPGMSPAGGKQLDPSVMSWLSGMSGKSPTGGMNPAAGGMSFAEGGLTSLKQGMYLGGPTDGMADELPATINGEQEAALSDGEFVVPADVVSHLGNGNSDAGAQVLYAMMDRVRKARTGNVKQGKRINPGKMLPK